MTVLKVPTIPPQNIPVYKTPLDDFLSHNPFPHPLTQGFFYREKMRAIHYIAPDQPFQDIAFSRLSHRLRQVFCTMLSPLTWLSYSLHQPKVIGTETASAWQKGGADPC